MAKYPALPLWTDAYLSDTRHLTTEQHGAYLLLLMEAWRRPSCALPGDEDMLARLAGLSPDRWAAIRDVVMGFWKFDGRKKEWTQLRLLDEREYVVKKSKSQRGRAANRWKSSEKTDAQPMPEECPADAPTPTPIIVDTNVSTLSETDAVSDQAEAAPRKGRKSYPPDFEAAWKEYPRTPNMSKSEALPEWRKLSDEDRMLVLPSIAGYRRYLASKPGLEIIHFCRYLSKRRFEGYAADDALPVSNEVWVGRLAHARANKVWSTAEWGPMPTQTDCAVPRGLLEQGDGVGWSEWKSGRSA